MRHFLFVILVLAVFLFQGVILKADNDIDYPEYNGTVLRITWPPTLIPGPTIFTYTIDANCLIEIDYWFPLVPGSIPKEIKIRKTHNGVVKKSTLGIRNPRPGIVGARHFSFFFKSIKPGQETIYLIIDDKTYEYHFSVVPSP